MYNFEEKLEEIKKNRKIISYAIPTVISEQEEEDAHKWWTSHKCFIEKNNSKDFSNLAGLIDELRLKDTHQYISELIKKDLSNSYVRIEAICDRQGFWLKPHCDIKEKLISCLLFANPFNESEDLGTDFYDKELNKVKTVPYKDNYGYFFSSGPNTWHGMEKKEIKKERRCLQVNYVTFKTDWKVQS